jgi:hypothetical protein
MSFQHFYKISTLFILLVFSTEMFPQTISDQLKVADSDFEIEYDGDKIKIIKQIITKRGSFHYYDGSESGHGYGYESYYLEFLYSHHLDITNEGRKIIEFFDAEDVLLTSFKFDESLRKKSHFPRYSKLKKYYAIDLCHVPLLILDDTKKIVIKYD